MRFLLDTHCWLWACSAEELLNENARELIKGRANEVLFSAASAWEIAIKFGRGKLTLPEPPEKYIPTRLASLFMVPLPVEIAHATHTSLLPQHHRDPFDRLLIAQAQLEDLPLMTADRDLFLYDVELIWAGTDSPPR